MRRKLIGIFICTLLMMITLPATDSKNVVIQDSIKEYSLIKNTEIRSSADIIEMIDEVHEFTLTYYLEKFVSFGPKKIGSENCSKTAEWIKQEFETLGLYTYFENWRFPKYKDRNVIAQLNGTDPTSDAIIVICAHYDTIGLHQKNISPGANDDGSGIAAMLTIANITSKYSFNHTVRFVAVSGEEVGCYGSFANAKKAYARNENILMVINLDMLGFTNNSHDGKYVHVGIPDRTKWLFDLSFSILQQYHGEIDLEVVPQLNYPCDHDSYNDYGYDGSWFTHFNPDQYHAMHTSNDTIDKINFTYLSKVTKLILAVTVTLATKPINVQVRIIRPYEGFVYLKNIRLLKLPCYDLWKLKNRAIIYIIGKTTVKINITTDETISNVYFAVDGYIKHVTNKPPYDYKIGKGNFEFYYKLHKGYHKIAVSVITNTGKTASDEIDIYLLKLL